MKIFFYVLYLKFKFPLLGLATLPANALRLMAESAPEGEAADLSVTGKY